VLEYVRVVHAFLKIAYELVFSAMVVYIARRIKRSKRAKGLVVLILKGILTLRA
jgi:hypothetical protein